MNNFFKRSELRDFIKKSVDNYYDLTSLNAMENYLLHDTNGEDYPISVRYFYLSNEYNETMSNATIIF